MLFMYSVTCSYDSPKTIYSGIICGRDMEDATRRLTNIIYEGVEEVHLYWIDGGEDGYISLTALGNFLKEHPLRDEED